VNSSGCFNWNGGLDQDGYGSVMLSKKRYRAHRASYEVFRGPIPDGHFVCHHCDNPSCINPAHLFTGTNQDNVTDCRKKGRFNAGNHGNHARGENAGPARLTAEQVLDIRKRSSDGELHRDIAATFATSPQNIEHIVSRRSWKHI